MPLKFADVHQQLLESASCGDIDTVRGLIGTMPRPEIDYQDSLSQTALHYALENNRVEVIKYLTASGAKLDVHDRSARSILFQAALDGHFEIVQCLVEASPNKASYVNAQDYYGDTVLVRAITNGHLEIIKYLIREGADPKIGDWKQGNAAFAAANIGHLDVVRYFIEEKYFGINDRDYKGRTCLHLAAKGNHGNIVKWLLDHDANPSTAFDLACTWPMSESHAYRAFASAELQGLEWRDVDAIFRDLSEVNLRIPDDDVVGKLLQSRFISEWKPVWYDFCTASNVRAGLRVY